MTRARALGSRVMSVEQFVKALKLPAGKVKSGKRSARPSEKDLTLSEREVAEWLELFGDGRDVEAEEA